VIGALAVAVNVVVASAEAAKGGNNHAAEQCQKGGWKTLGPDTGGTFANQGDCVNDGAQSSPRSRPRGTPRAAPSAASFGLGCDLMDLRILGTQWHQPARSADGVC
jgi:hypothetical protein